jgi:hypothetical protein
VRHHHAHIARSTGGEARGGTTQHSGGRGPRTRLERAPPKPPLLRRSKRARETVAAETEARRATSSPMPTMDPRYCIPALPGASRLAANGGVGKDFRHLSRGLPNVSDRPVVSHQFGTLDRMPTHPRPTPNLTQMNRGSSSTRGPRQVFNGLGYWFRRSS